MIKMDHNGVELNLATNLLEPKTKLNGSWKHHTTEL